MAEQDRMEGLYQALVQRALEARESSYSPYSGFAVGAALLCADGTVYPGCNIECASSSPTNCAERTAFFRAVSEGKREFLAIAVAGGPAGKSPEEFCPPCGVCRQVMAEFCGPDFEVILPEAPDRWTAVRFRDLLPMAFGPGSLEGGKRHADV